MQQNSQMLLILVRRRQIMHRFPPPVDIWAQLLRRKKQCFATWPSRSQIKQIGLFLFLPMGTRMILDIREAYDDVGFVVVATAVVAVVVAVVAGVDTLVSEAEKTGRRDVDASVTAVGAAAGVTVGVGSSMLSSSLSSSEGEISISSMEAHKSFSSDI